MTHPYVLNLLIDNHLRSTQSIRFPGKGCKVAWIRRDCRSSVVGKLSTIFCRKVLKIKIIIVYLQPAKMYCGA